jgi:hypothetical protein
MIFAAWFYRYERVALWFFVAASIVLRVWLAVVNRDANDDHMSVAGYIVSNGKLPHMGDCFECFQALLYHSLVARTIQVLGLTGRYDTYHSIGQVYALLAGLVTLAAGALLIVDATADARLRLRALALFACNPALVTLSVQATNDSFSTAFGSLCVWLMVRLTRVALTARLSITQVSWPCYAAILGGLSKGTGVVIYLGAAVLFAARAVAPDLGKGLRRNAWLALSLAVVPALVLFIAFGPYVYNYHARGSPFALGVAESGGLPKFCEPTPARRDEAWEYPGILSVCDGYLTFKIADVVRQPYITIGTDDYSGARTSLWTQIYARARFLFFEQWPPTWRLLSPEVIWTGRLAMLFGLLTMAVTGYGFFDALRHVALPPSLRGWIDRLWSPEGAIAVFGLAMLASSAWLNAVHRDSANMKAIYLYPAVLCAVWSFVRGATLLHDRPWIFGRSERADGFVGDAVFVNCVLYLTQISMLAWKLAF